MLIGYARVSTAEQNLQLQTDALKAAGCEKTFTDRISGAYAGRDGLTTTFSHLLQGDKLVVWKLDRLGMTVRQLVQCVEWLHDQGVNFTSVADRI